MSSSQELAAVLALPAPDFLLVSKATDPVGSSGGYRADTVARLLAAERERLVAPAETALERFRACEGNEERDPVERLRFFCSLAMRGQDWLDVEPFFADVLAERVPDAETKRLADVALRESDGQPLACDWMEAALKVCRRVLEAQR